jgi:hypothetical protein
MSSSKPTLETISGMPPNVGVGLLFLRVGSTPMVQMVPWPPQNTARVEIQRPTGMTRANGTPIFGEKEAIILGLVAGYDHLRLAIYVSEAAADELERLNAAAAAIASGQLPAPPEARVDASTTAPQGPPDDRPPPRLVVLP